MKIFDSTFLQNAGKITLTGCGCFPDEECEFDPINDVNNEVEFCCTTAIPDNLTFTKDLSKLAITYKFEDKIRCCVEPCDFNVEIGGIPCFSKICLVRLVGCIEYAVSLPLVEGDKTVGFNNNISENTNNDTEPEVFVGCSDTVCINKIVCFYCADEVPSNLQSLCPDLEDIEVVWDVNPINVQKCRNQKIIKFKGKFILPRGDECPVTTTTSSTSSTTTPTPPPGECCVKGSGGNLDDENNNKVSFEIGSDDNPLCNCNGTITGDLGYFQVRDNNTPPNIIYLDITSITTMNCSNNTVFITGTGDEYDGDPNNGGQFVAQRTFSLTLQDNPDELQMIIFRSPPDEPNYESGTVNVTSGNIIISDCPDNTILI